MANENGKIFGHVSDYDVRYVLGEVTRDIGELCTSENINIWSYNKPVIHNNPFASLKVDGWQQGEGSQEGYLDDTTCGLLVGNAHQTLVGSGFKGAVNKVFSINSDTNGFLYKLAKGTTGNWVYQRPEGVSKGSWYSLDDFRGYDHNAVNPMPQVKQIDAEFDIKWYQNGQFNLTLTQPDISLEQSLTNVTLDTLILPASMGLDNGNTLRKWYRGILLYSDDLTDVLWATETASQKEKGNNQVTFAEAREEGTPNQLKVTGRSGLYNAIVFFSSIELYPCDVNMIAVNSSEVYTPRFFLSSVDRPKKIALIAYGTPIATIEATFKKRYNDEDGKMYYYPQVVVTNNMPFSIVVRDVDLNNGFSLELESDVAENGDIIEFAKEISYLSKIGTSFKSSFTATVVIYANGETLTFSDTPDL